MTEKETSARGKRKPAAQEHVDSETKVREWLELQGYAIEHRTAAAFTEFGFDARQGLTYRDPTEGKVREADVVAAASLTDDKVELHAVVECKRSTKPWVTRTTHPSAFRKGRSRWIPIATPSVANYLAASRSILDDAIRLEDPTAFDIVEAHRLDPKSGDPAYGALAQVVSAASGLIANTELFPNPALFHLVVVLDAELFRVTYGRYPEFTLSRIDRERIHWSAGQAVSAPVVIDVVTVAAIDEYARNLRVAFGELAHGLQLAPSDFLTRPRIL